MLAEWVNLCVPNCLCGIGKVAGETTRDRANYSSGQKARGC